LLRCIVGTIGMDSAVKLRSARILSRGRQGLADR